MSAGAKGYLVLRGGQIANADGVQLGDLVCHQGKVVALGPHAAQTVPQSARDQGLVREIDVQGKYVLPGGIDPHTHFHLPFVRPPP